MGLSCICEKAYKPDSVPQSMTDSVIIYLVHSTRWRYDKWRIPSYMNLHPARFTVPPLLPSGRWALTSPFHPYSDINRSGLFSVALSVSLTLPLTILCFARKIAERGTCWCPDFPPHLLRNEAITRPSRLQRYSFIRNSNNTADSNKKGKPLSIPF